MLSSVIQTAFRTPVSGHLLDHVQVKRNQVDTTSDAVGLAIDVLGDRND